MKIKIILRCVAALTFLSVLYTSALQAAPIPGNCGLLDCTQRFVEAPNGVRLAVKEFGNPGNPAIMLIHGFSQSHLSWIRQLEDLAEKGFRVVAWDYPGHGDSDKPTDVNFYEQPMVWGGYVQAIIDDLAVDKVCLVGHSLGGTVIDDYIFSEGTENVAGVMYAGSLHRFDVGFIQLTDAFLATAPRLIDQELSVRLQATKDFNSILTLKSLPSEEVRDINMYNMLVIREAIQGLFAYLGIKKPGGYDKRVLNRLASVPILFVHGMQDAIVPFEVSEASLDLIKGAGGTDVELITLNRVGHSPQFDAQNKFNEDLIAFCGSHLNGD